MTYAEVLTRNIRAARSRTGLDQADVVERMRALGYGTWHRQTMGKVERTERRVTTEEILGLSLALETSIVALLAPSPDDKSIELPGGQPIEILSVQRLINGFNDNAVGWKGNTPVFTHGRFPAAELPFGTPRALAEHLAGLDRELRTFEAWKNSDGAFEAWQAAGQPDPDAEESRPG